VALSRVVFGLPIEVHMCAGCKHIQDYRRSLPYFIQYLHGSLPTVSSTPYRSLFLEDLSAFRWGRPKHWRLGEMVPARVCTRFGFHLGKTITV
jgi:hypothetical protein